MKIFAIFDGNGFPQSFYSADIHGDDIPSGAVSITQAQWLEFISNPGRRQWREGSVVEYVAPVPPPTPLDVDRERDRRVDAGFVFDGVRYQSRPEDRENIAGAKAAATDAITIYSAEPGNLAWQRLLDPNAPPEFRWIAADNSTHAMDAQTAMRFGYAALNHKQAHIFAARTLKDMNPIPADYAAASYWP